MFSPALPPEFPWPPSPSPSITQPPTRTPLTDALMSPHQTSSKQAIDFSPPLIAMVVIAAAAFLIVTYSRLISRHFLPPLLRQIRRYRRWRRRRQLLQIHRLPSSVGSVTDSPPYASSDVVYSPYGLDDSVIKSMPLSIFSEKNLLKGAPIDEFAADCAVCLLEFVENDYVRTLPLCAHSFHVDCIDVWLRSHATCPLCRAGVLPREWPFIPIMAARIRPSIDDGLLLDSIFLDPLPESPISGTRRRSESVITVPEIVPAPMIENDASPAEHLTIQSESRLKRSYSFGFERNCASERLVMEPATGSPWRYHQRRGSFSFWRRPSPFSSLTKPRVFSFRSSRGMKSPFFGRRRGGSAFVPLSESGSIRYAHYYSSSSAIAGSSRRSKSLASPMFGRSSAAVFSSSRMRCGDPEALISPERYGSR